MSDKNQQASSGDLHLPKAESDGQWTSIQVNGKQVNARVGENLAAALWAAGIRTLRHTGGTGAPRGIFCGMGVCFDCLVTIEGKPMQRACLMIVEPGMRVEMDEVWPSI